MYDGFSGFMKFWSSENNTENTMDLTFIMKKVTILMKIHVTIKSCTTILHHRKKLNIFTLQLPIYTYGITIGNLDWWKWGHCRNWAREKDCLGWEVDAMFIASAKIPERKGSILPSSFYGHLPNYYSHELALST